MIIMATMTLTIMMLMTMMMKHKKVYFTTRLSPHFRKVNNKRELFFSANYLQYAGKKIIPRYSLLRYSSSAEYLFKKVTKKET